MPHTSLWKTMLVGAALAAACIGSASAAAGEPCLLQALGSRHPASCGCKACRCADDYCAKPCPPVCPPSYCGCDDYCPPPPPCLIVPKYCGGCDDYCKSAPCIRKPCFPSFYRCPPKAGCCDWRNSLPLLPATPVPAQPAPSAE